MNDPKDVPEHSLSGAHKQGDVSSEGQAQPSGPVGADANSPVAAGQSPQRAPVRKANAPLPAAGQDEDDADPMARLTEIVSRATAQQEFAAAQMPEQRAPAVPSQAVSSQPAPVKAIPVEAIPVEGIPVQASPVQATPTPAAPSQASPHLQAVPPAMPPVVAVPQVEIAAEDRPAAPPPRPKSVTSGRFLGMLRAKPKGGQAAPAAMSEEPQAAPVKKGGWLRRKDARGRQQAEHQRRSAREKRWLRRRRRVWLEELLGWIFVPLILIGIYWGVMGVLTMLGTTPEAMISGFRTILGHF